MREQRARGQRDKAGAASSQQRIATSSRWVIGMGTLAFVIIIGAVIFATTQAGNRSQPSASSNSANGAGFIGSASPTAKPAPAIVSSHIPVLVSPADNTNVDSLDSKMTFSWQRVIDPSANYNIEFQYSSDGSNWGRSEIVYGLLELSYVRTSPFLNDHYARWRVWATTPSGDGDKSEWRQLNLPGQ